MFSFDLTLVDLQRLEIEISPAGVDSGDKVEGDAKKRGRGEKGAHHTSVAHDKVKPK